MYRLPTLLTIIVLLWSNFSIAQSSGWDELQKKLDQATTDSTRVLGYFEVASDIYRSAPEEAKEIITQGVVLAEKHHLEELTIDLLNLRGVIDLRLNNFDESVQTHFKVLKIREDRGDKKGMLLSLHNIGNVFNKSYDPDQALQYYERALHIAEEIKDTRNQANISTSIGNIYAQRALNDGNNQDVDKAIKFISGNVEFCKKNAPDVELFNSYILLSYLYLKADDIVPSEHYTNLAIAITEKKKDPVGICYARINRANLYVKKKQFDLAEQEVIRIKNVIKESGRSHLEEAFSADFEKIATAVKEKNHLLVLTDLDSTGRAFHKTAEEQRLAIREELREKYETEKKELENKNLLLKNAAIKLESDRVKLLWAATLGVLLTFTGMLFLLSKKNRQLRSEKEKVEQQSAEIKLQHAELVQADRFRSRIFSVVSHDLRTPIANFQSLLSASKIMDLPPESIKSVLIRIGQEVGVASKMLDELLVWSSQQMSSEKLEIQAIPVADTVHQCSDLFADRLHLKNLTLETNLSPSLTIRGDLKRFEFIVRNILNNAIKFSFIGKTIVINQQETANDIVLSIIDQGVGMDDEMIDSLKKQGMQPSGQGTLDEKGAGIGLMLCHEFANRMGWTIDIQSTPGLGSIFSIHIPR